MGDVKPRLRQAQQMINAGIGIVLRCSHVYESKAWGFTAADDFKNQAMEVDTDLAPEELQAAASADAGAGFRACSACRDSAGEGASRSGKNG